MPKNYRQYPKAKRQTIWNRIKSAAKKYRIEIEEKDKFEASFMTPHTFRFIAQSDDYEGPDESQEWEDFERTSAGGGVGPEAQAWEREREECKRHGKPFDEHTEKENAEDMETKEPTSKYEVKPSVIGITSSDAPKSGESVESIMGLALKKKEGDDDWSKPHRWTAGGPNTGENECWGCGKDFADPIHKVEEPTEGEGDESQACPHCDQEFKDAASFVQHWNKDHSSVAKLESSHQKGKYYCNVCGDSFGTREDAQSHVDHENIASSGRAKGQVIGPSTSEDMEASIGIAEVVLKAGRVFLGASDAPLCPVHGKPLKWRESLGEWVCDDAPGLDIIKGEEKASAQSIMNLALSKSKKEEGVGLFPYARCEYCHELIDPVEEYHTHEGKQYRGKRPEYRDTVEYHEEKPVHIPVEGDDGDEGEIEIKVKKMEEEVLEIENSLKASDKGGATSEDRFWFQYHCDICDQLFMTKDDLIDHQNVDHGGEVSLKASVDEELGGLTEYVRQAKLGTIDDRFKSVDEILSKVPEDERIAKFKEYIKSEQSGNSAAPQTGRESKGFLPHQQHPPKLKEQGAPSPVDVSSWEGTQSTVAPVGNVPKNEAFEKDIQKILNLALGKKQEGGRTCPECGMEGLSDEELQEHKDSGHEIDRPYGAPKSGKRRAEEEAQRVQIPRETREMRQKDPDLECIYCGPGKETKFGTTEELGRHIVSQHKSEEAHPGIVNLSSGERKEFNELLNKGSARTPDEEAVFNKYKEIIETYDPMYTD
jgi:uncharacterized C2H2 Zn-finger protein